jgi:RNA polymerase sigma factor (sigma-70 family)
MQHSGMYDALRHLHTLAAVRAAAALSDGELLGRFIERHDEAAFTALVERHGPIVLGVCRRVLHHVQDAEDACQATFLILVRKAATVRRRGSAASWLYGVALRTARKLRVTRDRQERRDRCRGEAVTDTVADDLSGREVRAVLDEELLRLPEKYRVPLVLCYLEGLTRDEAAQRLGLSHNRLRGRLDYGRGLLRGQLTRRGVVPATVPALLVVSTAKAAALTAAGQELPAGLISARVLALMEGMVRTMLVTNLQGIGAALLLVAGLGFAGVSAGMPAESGVTAPPKQVQPRTKVLEVPAKRAAPAPVPAQEENWADKALKGLTKHYALQEGEILKSFKPPHPEERKEFFRVVRDASQPDDKTEWDGNLSLRWNNGRLEFGTVTFGIPARGQSVQGLLHSIAGIVGEEVEGDRDLRWNQLIPGDFVVRAGVAPAKVVARLEEILNREFDLPIKMTLREADRTVYILEGKYKFSPIVADQVENHIEPYAKDLNVGPPPRAGSPPLGVAFPEFVYWLGRFVDRRIVLGKTEGLPTKIFGHENFLVPIPQEATPEERNADHTPRLVLKHIAQQTGLAVREEIRRVRVLIVERK